MKIKPAEYITVLRIIIFIFRGNWAKEDVIQRSQCVRLILSIQAEEI